ncbi:MAG: hypothetical protein H6959_07420 [Chromatiaceae bacterium]|nr:hypothetical protein [Gammaproteobacteria bacterium]MCP5300662.1 hypothetical protein [Chromatiaceae bacterium]MCP5422734.1 hypothetical protein [Chromatiaceae bacterium]
MRPLIPVLVLSTLVSTAVAAEAAGAPPPVTGATPCAAILVDSSAAGELDHDLVCSGARRAAAFLRRHGIGLEHRIRLRLYDQPIENHAGHIGLFDPAENRIELLTFAEARRLSASVPPFGLPMDQDLYTSYVAHETAHAIVSQHAGEQPPAWLAHEYIAYVVQLATMAEGLRAAVLGRYEIGAFADTDEISGLYYALDPQAFGVKAYRHFSALDDPATFLHGLLQGEVQLPDPQRDWW